MSSTEESSEEGTDKTPLSLGQVEGDGTRSEESSAVSGKSLDTEGLGIETLGAEGVGREGGRGGSGMSRSRISSSSVRLSSLEGGEGIDGISEGDGTITLRVGLPTSDALLQSSAVTYSVERSDAHISAVTYSVERSDLSEAHTSAVTYSVEHTSAVL